MQWMDSSQFLSQRDFFNLLAISLIHCLAVIIYKSTIWKYYANYAGVKTPLFWGCVVVVVAITFVLDLIAKLQHKLQLSWAEFALFPLSPTTQPPKESLFLLKASFHQVGSLQHWCVLLKLSDITDMICTQVMCVTWKIIVYPPINFFWGD